MAYADKKKELKRRKEYYRENRDKILEYKRANRERDNRRRRTLRIRRRNGATGRATLAWIRRVDEAVIVTQIVNHFAKITRRKKALRKPNYKILNRTYKRLVSKDIAEGQLQKP
jgi:hypothetical protein